MTVNTAAESKVYLGTTAIALTLNDYEADSYIAVGEVEDLGEFGDESEEVTFTSLNNARVRKFKGPRDAGTMTISCGNDSSDEGQQALVAAEAQPLDYNVKIELNDKLTLNGTPTTIYFSGKIMSKRLNVGNVSNVVRRMFNVGINTALFEVAPT